MEGWVNLGSTVVSKQFTEDSYVADIAVVNRSNRHALMDKWMMYTANPQLYRKVQ